MNDTIVTQQLLRDLFVILAAGLLAGIVCKRIRVPMVIGHLMIGAIIGGSMLNLLVVGETQYEQGTVTESVAVDATVTLPQHAQHGTQHEQQHELQHELQQAGQTGQAVQTQQTEQLTPETQKNGRPKNTLDVTIGETLSENSPNASSRAHYQRMMFVEREMLERLANIGVILLLFAIGIQFSPSELTRMKKYFTVGGATQMIGTIIPIIAFFCWMGYDWKVGLIIGSAASLSSTVLVFKSLEDLGYSTSSNGKRMIAILLFQDVATVPLLLLIPLLGALGGSYVETQNVVMTLILNSFLFLAVVLVLRFFVCTHWVQRLPMLKSVEVLVLFSVVLIFLVCGAAMYLELPAALGALAAGVILSENRLTAQISAITLPFRESFSAIFFVSLGALFDYHILFDTPLLTLGCFFGLISLKTIVGGIAFRILGVAWKPALALGLGMSQLGELSFVILSDGVNRGMFENATYQRMLFIALTSLVMTPLFLKIAIRMSPPHLISGGDDEHHHISKKHSPFYERSENAPPKTLVVGIGPIGARIVSYLEISGADVYLMDMNPVNLHLYAQQGFRTVAGDATNLSSLQLAEISECTLAVVTVPIDGIALEVVRAIRTANPKCSVFVRCRFIANAKAIKRAGADIVVVEEAETGVAMTRVLERLLS